MLGNTYAERARSFAIYPDVGNDVIYPALGLSGEAGELCNKVKKLMRDKSYQVGDELLGVISEQEAERLQYELGDVLWYVALMAHELGTDLNTVMAKNLSKLKSRHQRGALGGSGDER